MDDSTLQLFRQQLANWAEAAIENGRSPFRKVEISPALVTERGELRPDLVFWINRDSCMAGGIVIFPSGSEGEELENGRACAEALGLKHLVSWEPREIVFWELLGSSFSRHKTIDVSELQHPSSFRDALTALMEELKVLAVLGAIPPERLSSYYLANLCLGTRDAALPSLTGDFRLARGEALVTPQESPSQLADKKAAMTLLRLLALVLHDRLPATVQPEGLERAMIFALEDLPAHCQTVLKLADNERPLPATNAVFFHHLFRRLTQLNLHRDRLRSIRLLEILFAQDSKVFGGHPLPASERKAIEGELLLHPDRLPRQRDLMVIAADPLLACAALARNLSDLPPLQLQTSGLFSIPPETAPRRIRGTLCDDSIPSGQDRRNLIARLRLAWPARRFPLPKRTPAWVWELLHLLGISAPDSRLHIAVPSTWLTEDYGRLLFEVLREQFCLDQLALEGEHVQMRLRRTRMTEGMTIVTSTDGERHLPWGENGIVHPALLTLALHLPPELFGLLEREILRIPEASTAIDSHEAFLFCQSSLGHLFWTLVSANRPIAPENRLIDEIRQWGMPLPEPGILANLGRLLSSSAATTQPLQDRLDEELELWLGSDFSIYPSNPKTKTRESMAKRSRASKQDDLQIEKIAATVFVDGLPRFPEQYLYDYYRPQIEEYHFAGSLTAGEEFFGRHLLHDREGNAIEVEGEETAQALLLASFSGRQPVALPADRQLTSAILNRYLDDLRNLRRNLLRKTHLQTAGSRAAENLAKKIWLSRELPPWELLDD